MTSRKSKATGPARSPYGWWIASYIERFEWRGGSKNGKAKCLAYENTIVLRAKDAEVAFKKAVRLSRSEPGWRRFGDPPGRAGRWVFEGLTKLLPIYERITDGAEVLWMARPNTTVGAIRRRVKSKSQLEVFRPLADT